MKIIFMFVLIVNNEIKTRMTMTLTEYFFSTLCKFAI